MARSCERATADACDAKSACSSAHFTRFRKKGVGVAISARSNRSQPRVVGVAVGYSLKGIEVRISPHFQQIYLWK